MTQVIKQPEVSRHDSSGPESRWVRMPDYFRSQYKSEHRVEFSQKMMVESPSGTKIYDETDFRYAWSEPARPGGHVADLIAELDVETRSALFQVLRDDWVRDNRFQSASVKIINHPAYQLITMFGQTMIPLILEDLREKKRHWFHALRILTGYLPPKEECTNMKKMCAAWISWGTQKQLIGSTENKEDNG